LKGKRELLGSFSDIFQRNNPFEKSDDNLGFHILELESRKLT
jgi:hypothetical protein